MPEDSASLDAAEQLANVKLVGIVGGTYSERDEVAAEFEHSRLSF